MKDGSDERWTDATWLHERLAEGRSVESIARELGRPATTVAYWVAKHGLRSAHAERHAPHGGLERETLAALVATGCSIRTIAERTGVSYATVRHWLRRYELRTARAARMDATGVARSAGEGELSVVCCVHGTTPHRRRADGGVRCLACRSEAVVRRRKEIKAILVREAGGVCLGCGYSASLAALQFHHVDPTTKAFGLGRHGHIRSLAAARAEAAKCLLLCATCHAEVEAGHRTLGAA